MKYLVLLFLFLSLSADKDYSLRFAHGKVTDSTFGEVLFLDIKPYPEDLKVTALDGGYALKKRAFDLPFDIYARAGFAQFDEAGLQDDIYEGTLYLKAYWNIDFLKNRVRIGLGEGVSYTSGILYVEKKEAIDNNDNNSKILNYMEVSVDFDLAKLIRYKPLDELYLGFTLKHRSGVFGLINDVEKGGSNYYTFSIEKNF
ncbi:hypothetical protein [Sulfurimonas sp.]|uniref:hypothetical protein n=1 Tax=Sulfurimonas sp. TaxID=2022749 RepID=UPI002B482D4C|nr:hypothetical protein [Sulfurimonas sp.]